jgi:hypothetical protein
MAANNDIIRTEKDGIEFFTVVATGESAISERGLSRMSGVPQKTLNRWLCDLSHVGVPIWLKPLAAIDLRLSHEIKKHGKTIKPINSRAAWKFLMLVAKNLKTLESLDSIDAIGEIGINSFIQGVTGWLPEKYQSNPEARNRILNQKQKKTHPLFGDENMNKVANFLKVGRSHPKLANWMWAYIYCTFSQEEICKLNSRNPVQPNGHRKDCVYEWLDENSTQKHKEHFDKVLTLVQISTSEQEFANMFNRMFNQTYQQELLKTQPF